MPAFIDSFRVRMGLNAYASGKYDKAEAWFRTLETTEPDSLRVLRNLGVILLAQGKREEAEKYFRREESRFGKSYHRHCILADIAYAAGKRDEAIKRYKAALEYPDKEKDEGILASRLAICSEAAAFKKSRLAGEAFDLAETARREKRFAEALEGFDKAVSLDPTAWPALNNAGTIYLNDLKEPAKALEKFSQALAIARPPHVARNAVLAEEALARGKGAFGSMGFPLGALRRFKAALPRKDRKIGQGQP
jgi:tetratricopeptide (TPR) repeat protein